MNSGVQSIVLATKYAQAFLRVNEKKLQKKEYDAILKAASDLQKKLYLLQIVDAPTLEIEDKMECVKKMLEYYSLPDACKHLARLLIVHGRFGLFAHVLSSIVDLYYKYIEVCVITIYTSCEVTQDDIVAIEKFVANKTKKQVISRHVVSSSLIAGVRIESDQFVWDHSVQNQLRNVSLL